VPPATALALALRLGLALKLALGLALDMDGGRLDTGDANGSVEAVFGRVECCISGILGVDEDDELEGMLGLDDADEEEGALGLESDIFEEQGAGVEAPKKRGKLIMKRKIFYITPVSRLGRGRGCVIEGCPKVSHAW